MDYSLHRPNPNGQASTSPSGQLQKPIGGHGTCVRGTCARRTCVRKLWARAAVRAILGAALSVAVLAGCESETSGPVDVPTRDFLDGTMEDPQIGLIVNSLGNALRLFQVGDPSEVREVPLGASSAVTPTGLAVRGERALVPLGNAASIALIDLRGQRIEEFYLFSSGNATGSAWVDDNTAIVANMTTNQVGKISLNQSGNVVSDLLDVAPVPSAILTSDDRVLVISGNLDENFAPIGEAIVTAINPTTMSVVDTVSTGGNNAQSAAIGPDGLLYVINTGNYFDPSTLAIIDPTTMELVEVVDDIGVGAGSIYVDEAGLAFISGFFFGTTVWDTETKTWVRGGDNPVCAPLAEGGCRGAFGVTRGVDGRLYQAFFGSSSQGLAPWIFVYDQASLALTDSIDAGLGPVGIEVHSFEN